jgi:transcriptional regulator with XRE-family HTH domain
MKRADMSSPDTLDAYVRRRLTPYLEGASQGALAAAVGLRQQQISDYKRGQWKQPPLDVLDRLARAFGLTLAGILAEMPAEDARPAWQRRLYTAIAGIATEEAAQPVLWVTGRAQGAPTETASTSPPRVDRRGSTSRTARKHDVTA